MRVALIYDDLLRPDTTGVHCRAALEGLCEVRHFLPRDLGQMPTEGFDLYLNIDDGLQYTLPPTAAPRAWWVIDTHVNYDWDLVKAQDFDTVFAAQRDGAQRLEADGIANVQWLPLACNPTVHRRREVEKVHDVCFVGNLVAGERQRLVELLQREFERVFVGRAYGEDMARTYSQSRIVFNRSVANDVNMRVFEAVACGSLLVTNDLADNGQEELLRSGEHLVTYRDDGELLERIRHYLAHEDEREALAQQGMEEVHAQHTYRHRMETILEAVAAGGQPRRSGASSAYYHFRRPELVALVPPEATSVLDIGCGAGRMGEALKRRQACRVVGVEQCVEAAQEAGGRLDEVVVGDIEDPALSLGEAAFDCIVCGDVLEHLRNPQPVLERLARALTPEATLVASIPNVRNCQVVRDLAAGFWTYESAGVLDATHLRFFTLGEVLDLFAASGLEVQQVRPVFDEQVGSWRAAGQPTSVQLGPAGLALPSVEDAEELFVIQYLVTAQRRRARAPGLASIIILAWNELPYTRLCVESVLRNTSPPFELVLVDNGSTDGTPEYFAGLADAKFIRNETNLGFPKGVNQGIEAASGEYLVLLNNDTIVPPGWLDRMVAAAESGDDVGMVGPICNYTTGDQLIAVPYHQMSQVDAFAARAAWRHRGQRVPTNRLLGFCLLAKRAALEQVGLLDEAFGIGTFEDDDLSMRMRQAGYRLLVARDCFVHHFGSRTFIAQGIDTESLLESNWERFSGKWGLEGQPQKVGTSAPPATPRLSLCMIARDEEANIARCLESIRPWVDEMIVVDTGSRDGTPEIARECGARVEHFAWCDDFSAARNESLKYATGDWVFWMDADDVIDAGNGARLRELAASAPPEVYGFTARVRCLPRPGEEAGAELVDHVKLIRNHPEVRFQFHIHEQILPSIRRLGKQLAYSDVFVTHAGYDTSPAGQARKRERDLKLLRLDLAEHPDHPFVHFNLGMTAFHTDDLPTAAHHLRQSIELAGPDESHLRKAYALLVGCHRRQGHWPEARGVCEEGLRTCPGDPELLFNQGMVCHQLGDLPAAERAYRAILDDGGAEPYLRSVDVGIAGFKTRHNLAILYRDMARLADAARELRAAVTEEPAFVPSWLAWGELAQGTDAADEVLGLARELCVRADVRGVPGLVEAAMLAGQQRHSEALRAAEGAVQAGLGANEAHGRRLQAHSLLRLGQYGEAVGVLQELVALAPEDIAAHGDLAAALAQAGQGQRALEVCEKAVARWPTDGRLRRLRHDLSAAS